MKIVILKNISVNGENPRLGDAFSKCLSKNDIVYIDNIEILDNSYANLVLDNGDELLEVPTNAFEVLNAKTIVCI
jgi:hypothetical protein